MQTVGSMLHAARTSRGLTYKQVEVATKIREKFLTAIESDDYSKLPSLAYAKGFVKNYSEFLGLDSTRVLAFFRRQTLETPRSSLLPPQPIRAARTFLQLTPGRFLVIIVSAVLTVFFLYFLLQFQTIQSPPALVLTSPDDAFVTVESRVDILGNTDTDATVTINGVSVLVRSDGKFFDQVSLEPGRNVVTIEATSRFGKVTSLTRVITYEEKSH